MPIRYTGRKGREYYLCETTRRGKSRYVFSREPTGQVLDAIPEGYEISETANGVVSLRKAQPVLITPAELDHVRAALAARRDVVPYAVEVRKDTIVVLEPTGLPDPDGAEKLMIGKLAYARLMAEYARHARYEPVLRFVLADPVTRRFAVERMCFLGSIDDWLPLHTGKLPDLAAKYIAHLGKESFFGLM